MRFYRIFLLLLLLFTLPLCACHGVQAKAAPGERNTEEIPFLSRLTFLGDSTTAHMEKRAPLPESSRHRQIWCPKERYLNLDHKITYAKIVCPENGQEMTIAEAAAMVKPEFLVITLGVDYGVYYYRDEPQKFRACYEKLLDAVKAASPDTTLILQSIFPVGRKCTVLTNEMIDKANAEIAAIAAERGLFYADANRLLKDSEGFLAREFADSADGIHLTAAAYEVILKNLEDSEAAIRRTVT